MNLFSVTLTFFYFAFQVSSIFLQKRKKEKKVVFNFNQLKCLVDYQEGLTFLQMDPCFVNQYLAPPCWMFHFFACMCRTEIRLVLLSSISILNYSCFEREVKRTALEETNVIVWHYSLGSFGNGFGEEEQREHVRVW